MARLPDLSDRLDAALGGTDLGVQRIPIWAGLVRVLQWGLILSAVAGALWLTALAGMAYLQMPEPETPTYQGIPVPTIMLLGGVALGVLLALLCRILVAVTASRRARSADRRLRDGHRRGVPRAGRRPDRGRAGGVHAGAQRPRQGAGLILARADPGSAERPSSVHRRRRRAFSTGFGTGPAGLSAVLPRVGRDQSTTRRSWKR